MKKILALILFIAPFIAQAQVTGLELPYGVKVLDTLATDAWYGPYQSVEHALESVPEAVRKHRTVKIGTQEYWWRDGSADEDLILKDEFWRTKDITNLTENVIINSGFNTLQIGEYDTDFSFLKSGIEIGSTYGSFKAADPDTGEGTGLIINNSSFQVGLFDNSGNVISGLRKESGFPNVVLTDPSAVIMRTATSPGSGPIVSVTRSTSGTKGHRINMSSFQPLMTSGGSGTWFQSELGHLSGSSYPDNRAFMYMYTRETDDSPNSRYGRWFGFVNGGESSSFNSAYTEYTGAFGTFGLSGTTPMAGMYTSVSTTSSARLHLVGTEGIDFSGGAARFLNPTFLLGVTGSTPSDFREFNAAGIEDDIDIIFRPKGAGVFEVESPLTIGEYTLPATDGTAGQVLKTDGSGNVTWEDESGGGGGTDAESIRGVDIESAASSPSDGDILVYRSSEGEWVLEEKPSGGGSPDWGDIGGDIGDQEDLSDSLASKANLAGATFTGKVNFSPDGTNAGLNIGGVSGSPSGRVASDVWTDTSNGRFMYRSTDNTDQVMARFNTSSVVTNAIPIIGAATGRMFTEANFTFSSVSGVNSISTPGIVVSTRSRLPSDTEIGSVSATEIGYVDGVTSAIQTQLNARAVITPTTATGTSVAFDTNRSYCTTDSPCTGNITFNSSGAVVGQIATMVHNDSSEPTFGAEFIILSGTYAIGENNYIMFFLRESGKIWVTISQEQ